MRLALKETRLGLRNSTTRIPFRYGSACLTRCPQAVLQAVIEVAGRRQSGYGGDCLPPSWFDKSPGKDFQTQIDDMLAVIALAEKTFAEEFASPTIFFPAWQIAYERVHSRAAEWGLTPLLASFGVSLVERAIIDAVARAAQVSFAQLVRSEDLGIVPAHVHARLADLSVRDWLPATPTTSVFVRHTVGLGDPLLAAEIQPSERLNDGFPQALEEYVERTGTRYFKVKVSNRLDWDLDRLRTIAALVQRRRGDDYRLTLDGNEQYHSAAEFDELITAIEAAPELATLWQNTLLTEQPLARDIALDDRHTDGIRRLSRVKPVIIDESDGGLDSFARAMDLGYRGVSSKNCKGPVKSLLNAGLVWLANGRGKRYDFLMTGEDLCSVGIIPTQADLCLAANLGLAHVERNGHHFHPGLSYLPQQQQQAALAAHGDFYARQHGIVSPRLVDGRFEIGSLQCVGFGFAVEPDFSAMQPPAGWEFSSLGLPG
jgi:L-alanine-DL-glutamate epimerase-like enolase superfamily enzyme